MEERTVGKTVFITGAASGIGRAMARHFAGRGWRVGLADIDRPGLDATAELLSAEKFSVHPFDVRDRAAWDQALVDFAPDGRIDVVCNNAGVAFAGPLTANATDEIDRLIDVNFRGVVYGAQAAHPYLKAAAPRSCLLNTASAAAIYGTAGLAVYSATKFAVRALTEALDIEWHDDGIRVRSLMPSFIDTPLLHGPAGANSNQWKRDAVVAAGLEFTPLDEVAAAAWSAVHGSRLHTLVGMTARQIGFAAKWTPALLRRRARRLMLAFKGDER